MALQAFAFQPFSNESTAYAQLFSEVREEGGGVGGAELGGMPLTVKYYEAADTTRVSRLLANVPNQISREGKNRRARRQAAVEAFDQRAEPLCRI